MVTAFRTPAPGWWPAVALALIPLVLLSLAAHLLEMRRYFAYGLLSAAVAVTGEWLWRKGLAMILTCLHVVDGADFTFLRNQTGPTWGIRPSTSASSRQPGTWP